MTPPVTADLLGFSRTTISRLYSDSESPKKEVSIQRVAVVKKKKKTLLMWDLCTILPLWAVFRNYQFSPRPLNHALAPKEQQRTYESCNDTKYWEQQANVKASPSIVACACSLIIIKNKINTLQLILQQQTSTTITFPFKITWSKKGKQEETFFFIYNSWCINTVFLILIN